MRTVKPYRSYRFTGQDPMVPQIMSVVESSGKDYVDVNEGSGVAVSTMYNWRRRKTKRPQFASMNAVARSVGYELKLVKRSDG